MHFDIIELHSLPKKQNTPETKNVHNQNRLLITYGLSTAKLLMQKNLRKKQWLKLGDGVKYHLQVIRKKRIVASSSAAASDKTLHDFESDLCFFYNAGQHI